MGTLREWPALSPGDRMGLGLSKRVPKADATVTARNPEVLDMWDETNPFGPSDVPSSSPVKVKWVCVVGHRFVESAVVQCGAVSGWRAEAGGSRACKHCYEDQREDRVRLACGHSVLIQPGVEDRGLCWSCNDALFQQNKPLVLSTRDALLPDARVLADQALEERQIPTLFRNMVQGKLAHAIAYDTAIALIRGVQPPTLDEIPKAVRLLHQPSAAEIGRSVAHAEPVEMFGAQFWSEGFGLPTSVTPNYDLGLPFARAIATKIQKLLPLPLVTDTAIATRFLTQEIKTLLYTNPFMKELRVTVAGELRLPVAANSGDVRPGRLDLTAMYGVVPSIVIELDSTNKASSLRKLQYARDRGAYPIWVRWNATKGASLSSPGVITVSPAGTHGYLIGEETPS